MSAVTARIMDKIEPQMCRIRPGATLSEIADAIMAIRNTLDAFQAGLNVRRYAELYETSSSEVSSNLKDERGILADAIIRFLRCEFEYRSKPSGDRPSVRGSSLNVHVATEVIERVFPALASTNSSEADSDDESREEVALALLMLAYAKPQEGSDEHSWMRTSHSIESMLDIPMTDSSTSALTEMGMGVFWTHVCRELGRTWFSTERAVSIVSRGDRVTPSQFIGYAMQGVANSLFLLRDYSRFFGNAARANTITLKNPFSYCIPDDSEEFSDSEETVGEELVLALASVTRCQAFYSDIAGWTIVGDEVNARLMGAIAESVNHSHYLLIRQGALTQALRYMEKDLWALPKIQREIAG